MDDDDKIVRVKKKDLQGLIDANTEAYNALDNITMSLDNVQEGVKKAFNALEDAPTSVDDLIVEDEEEEK